MKITILTDLAKADDSYSVWHVARDQYELLTARGHNVKLLVRATFNRHAEPQDFVSSVLTYVKDYHYAPNEAKQHRFDGDVTTLAKGDNNGIGYHAALEGAELVITHDLMTCSWHLPHNVAVRRTYADDPPRRYLHWCHSMPMEQPEDVCEPSALRWRGGDRGIQYIFPSETAAALAKEHMTDVDPAVVYNIRDPRQFYGINGDAEGLIKEYELLKHDIFQVYPFATPRWQTKGVPTLLKIFGKFKKAGKRVKLLLANSQGDNEFGEDAVRSIVALGAKNGLQLADDLVITSRDFRFPKAVPWRTLQGLTKLSNLFIFPSVTECCSLIQAEAALSGCLLVLNADFSPMMEFVHPETIRYEFSKHDPERDDFYYERVSRHLLTVIDRNSLLQNQTLAKTKIYNRDWIFENQLSPLLEGTNGNGN
jgi:glycosyltransferase involved in cell wall biosynthesis